MKILILCLMILSTSADARVLSSRIVDVKLRLSKETFRCGFWGELGSPVEMYLEVPALKKETALNHVNSNKVPLMHSRGCLVDVPEQDVETTLEIVLSEELEVVDDFFCNRTLIEDLKLELFGQIYSHSQVLRLGRVSVALCR